MFVVANKWGVKALSERMSLFEEGMKATLDAHAAEIKKMTGVLITLGRYEERFLRIEGMIDDLRRGRGFIEDFTRARD